MCVSCNGKKKYTITKTGSLMIDCCQGGVVDVGDCEYMPTSCIFLAQNHPMRMCLITSFLALHLASEDDTRNLIYPHAISPFCSISQEKKYKV